MIAKYSEALVPKLQLGNALVFEAPASLRPLRGGDIPSPPRIGHLTSSNKPCYWLQAMGAFATLTACSTST